MLYANVPFFVAERHWSVCITKHTTAKFGEMGECCSLKEILSLLVSVKTAAPDLGQHKVYTALKCTNVSMPFVTQLQSCCFLTSKWRTEFLNVFDRKCAPIKWSFASYWFIAAEKSRPNSNRHHQILFVYTKPMTDARTRRPVIGLTAVTRGVIRV